MVVGSETMFFFSFQLHGVAFGNRQDKCYLEVQPDMNMQQIPFPAFLGWEQYQIDKAFNLSCHIVCCCLDAGKTHSQFCLKSDLGWCSEKKTRNLALKTKVYTSLPPSPCIMRGGSGVSVVGVACQWWGWHVSGGWHMSRGWHIFVGFDFGPYLVDGQQGKPKVSSSLNHSTTNQGLLQYYFVPFLCLFQRQRSKKRYQGQLEKPYLLQTQILQIFLVCLVMPQILFRDNLLFFSRMRTKKQKLSDKKSQFYRRGSRIASLSNRNAIRDCLFFVH